MGCEVFTSPDGKVVGIMCSRGGKTQQCAECKKRKAGRLCDWKLKGDKAGKTCDRPLCATCSVTPILQDGSKAKDKDLCPVHSRLWERMKTR
jgi:hypothetical protein